MGRVKKQRREDSEAVDSRSSRPPASPPQDPWVSYVTLGGVAVVLALTLASWRVINRIDSGMPDRLEKIDTRIAQLAAKVDNLPAQKPRRGLDPNKVYPVKTAGSPAKGPVDAPVVIAEFSDFQ